jgi:hypothetical protein
MTLQVHGVFQYHFFLKPWHLLYIKKSLIEALMFETILFQNRLGLIGAAGGKKFTPY